MRSLSLALLALVLPSAAATASSTAPVACGHTSNGHYDVHVSHGTPCAFGKSTYAAIQAYDRAHPDFFCSACEKNFVVRVTSGGRHYPMDCRSLTRAHGELDFSCNDVNYGAARVVKLSTLLEP